MDDSVSAFHFFPRLLLELFPRPIAAIAFLEFPCESRQVSAFSCVLYYDD
jgi:hypothetical protein